jgi:hypothetical protein
MRPFPSTTPSSVGAIATIHTAPHPAKAHPLRPCNQPGSIIVIATMGDSDE